MRDYSFQLYCNGNLFMQKLSNFPISKRGLMVKFARLTSTCKTEIQYELEDAYDLLTGVLASDKPQTANGSYAFAVSRCRDFKL